MGRLFAFSWDAVGPAARNAFLGALLRLFTRMYEDLEHDAQWVKNNRMRLLMSLSARKGPTGSNRSVFRATATPCRRRWPAVGGLSCSEWR